MAAPLVPPKQVLKWNDSQAPIASCSDHSETLSPPFYEAELLEKASARTQDTNAFANSLPLMFPSTLSLCVPKMKTKRAREGEFGRDADNNLLTTPKLESIR
jgi:hypothetical protein